MTTDQTTSPRDQILALRDQMRAAFVERGAIIDGALCAILSFCHVLLLGVPGTAKSALTTALARAFGAAYYERLLTKFSTPEEVFGPVSLKAMEQDDYRRVTTRKLPEAKLAFIDECFKANSAILNSLLKVINERVYENGSTDQPCPLVSLFGASNELPEDASLRAFWDRFMLRYDVQPIRSRANLKRLLMTPKSQRCKVTVQIDAATLAAAQAEVESVVYSEATADAELDIKDALASECGISASDRRWIAVPDLIRAVAWLAGRAETCPEDLAILADSLWDEPKERTKVAAVVGRLADPIGAKINEILDAAREIAVATQAQRGNDEGFVKAAVKAHKDLQAQVRKLRGMADEASERNKTLIDDAVAEIDMVSKDFARAVAAGMGLRAAS